MWKPPETKLHIVLILELERDCPLFCFQTGKPCPATWRRVCRKRAGAAPRNALRSGLSTPSLLIFRCALLAVI
jgi:hypothetical protein